MKVCWKCGKENPTRKFDLFERDSLSKTAFCLTDIHQREYCEDCFSELSKEKSQDQLTYTMLKSKLMFERAIKMLERQNIEIYDYKDAIDAVQEFAQEKPEKFQSSHEMIAAIILADNEMKVQIQHKIGKYRVDFCIPQLKVILEIDGYLHEFKPRADKSRDVEIRKLLGTDWETVRIPTKYLEQKAELLVEAIKSMKTEMQKVRKENYGLLPDWFSKKTKTKG